MRKSVFPFKKLVFLLIGVPVLIGTACARPLALSTAEPSAPSQAQPSSPSAQVEESSLEEDAQEVFFRPEGFAPPAYPPVELGSVNFSADTDATQILAWQPGDAPSRLQVVDQGGFTWTLVIPEGALENKQIIQITPLTQIDSSAFAPNLGKMVSGVRLEPDGLTVLKPMQLSVSGAGIQKTTLLLAGSHTGTEIAYSLQESAAQIPTAQILHFSTYFASPISEEDLPAVGEDAWKEYRRLSADVQKLRKTPLEIPTPPSIPIECQEGENAAKNNALVQQFIENALNPEYALLLQVLQQRTTMALVGNHAIDDDWRTEIALAGRMARKATAMLDQFDGQAEKLVAVSRFALTAARNLQLLGGEANLSDQILSKLAVWNSELVDQLIADIRENHAYKKIPVVWQIAYQAQLLGGAVDMEKLIEKLQAALRFELEYQFEVVMPDINNITRLAVPVQFNAEQGAHFYCEGSGQGEYTQAEVDDEEITVEAFPYPVRVVVKEFDPCNETVTIGIDRFASDQDTITITTEDFSETRPWPISYNASKSLFEEELQEGMFWFVLPVQNGSMNAVDETIERSKFDAVEGVLTIRLIHK